MIFFVFEFINCINYHDTSYLYIGFEGENATILMNDSFKSYKTQINNRINLALKKNQKYFKYKSNNTHKEISREFDMFMNFLEFLFTTNLFTLFIPDFIPKCYISFFKLHRKKIHQYFVAYRLKFIKDENFIRNILMKTKEYLLLAYRELSIRSLIKIELIRFINNADLYKNIIEPLYDDTLNDQNLHLKDNLKICSIGFHTIFNQEALIKIILREIESQNRSHNLVIMLNLNLNLIIYEFLCNIKNSLKNVSFQEEHLYLSMSIFGFIKNKIRIDCNFLKDREKICRGKNIKIHISQFNLNYIILFFLQYKKELISKNINDLTLNYMLRLEHDKIRNDIEAFERAIESLNT